MDKELMIMTVIIAVLVILGYMYLLHFRQIPYFIVVSILVVILVYFYGKFKE